VALVGFGFGGSMFHAPFIAAEPRLELTSVVTQSPQRQSQVLARYPRTQIYQSVEDLFRDLDDVDLVVISTPNATHAAIAREVLAGGLPVVVDKPVAPSVEEIRDLAALAKATGTAIVPYQNRRFDGDFRTVEALLVSGELGVVHTFESRYERWQPEVPKGPERSWKREPTPGTGVGILYDLGTHLIDQAVVLFGRPESVYAEVDIRRPDAAVDDDVFIALEYQRGPRVHLWMSAVAADLGPRFRLLGSEAAYVKYGMDVQESALIAGRTPGEAGWGEEPATSWGRIERGSASTEVPTLSGAYSVFYTGIAEFLFDGAAPPVNIGDAVVTAEIIEAAARAASSRAVVRLTS
jgi:scyllo-inositol 2-dehydrogenase (NADP+)